MTRIGSLLLAAVASAGLASSTTVQAQQAEMSFFISSIGKGNGADLGGIAGADTIARRSPQPPARPAPTGAPI